MGTLAMSVEMILIALLGIIHSAYSLDCYSCNSSLDYHCQEFFDHSDPLNPLSPVPCTVNEARYCIKATGLWGGVVGTHRFCSAKHMGYQCSYVSYPDHDRLYRACVFTCWEDGCNHSNIKTAHTLTLLLPLISLLFVLFHWIVWGGWVKIWFQLELQLF